MYRVGIIGFGERITGVAKQAQAVEPDFKIVAVCDPYYEESLERSKSFETGVPDLTGTNFYRDIEEMLSSEKLDGVMIGTRCPLHTPYAIRIMQENLPFFLEKPVGVDAKQLAELEAARLKYNPKVVVSFPLRACYIVELAKELIDSGRIGTVEHIQADNNVPYGSVYFQHWYRDESVAHGLWLAKTTHDFDYINYLAGQVPTKIIAAESKQIFKGDKPAGLKCVDCQEYKTCKDSPFVAKIMNGCVVGEYCAYAVDTGNMDSGSAIIKYKNGMHASYSQNFFVRNGAGKRGARVMGYEGTIDFDFYKAELVLHRHHIKSSETYTFTDLPGHFGGDTNLCLNFMELMRGEGESHSTLADGILSAHMCLAAGTSNKSEKFENIDYRI